MICHGDEEKALLLRGGRLIDPTLGLDCQGDVLVKAGRIAAMGAGLADKTAEEFSARGLVICPGLVDIHVHFRTPGETHKEDLVSGSAAAAAGGFTAVACEPNTRPPLDSGIMVRDLALRARAEGRIPIYVKGCLTLAGLGEESPTLQSYGDGALVEVAEMKACGAIALSSDPGPIESPSLMKEALTECRRQGLLPMIHAEASGKVPLQGNSHRREPELVARDIGLAGEARAPVHFSHISTLEAVEAIHTAKNKGLAITAEATPHHLALCEEEMPAGDANFKTNPPLRRAADREVLRNALAQGVIDCIATDHAPHTAEEKAQGFAAAPFGLIGLETALGVILTEMYHPRLMSLLDIIKAMSARPRALLGLPEVRLAEGFPADLTLFDPEAEWVVDPTQFKSKARNCPFAGKRLKGRPVAVVISGELRVQS